MRKRLQRGSTMKWKYSLKTMKNVIVLTRVIQVMTQMNEEAKNP
jgi:hypothetical protein